ncbi:MAG: lamin tail domain-containing protein, partial [Calditrichaeota bacterium]|nr:lamin tail domain-containing protein [Calditrichota bacterium]
MNRTIVILLFMCNALFGQIRITEVMFDPVGAERTDEFVELFNAGTTAVNLEGWFIGDSVSVDLLVSLPGFGFTLQPEQFAVILDPDYIADSSLTYE